MESGLAIGFHEQWCYLLSVFFHEYNRGGMKCRFSCQTDPRYLRLEMRNDYTNDTQTEDERLSKIQAARATISIRDERLSRRIRR